MPAKTPQRQKRPPGLLQRLAFCNYETAKLYSLAKLHRRARTRRPVWVYQMGKVGSMSVVRSLETIPGIQLLHVHFLDPQAIRQMDARFRRLFRREPVVPEALVHSEYCRRVLERGGWDRTTPVITLVRDPIARNVSDFFHGFRYQHPEIDLRGKLERSTAAEVAAEILPLFLQTFDHDRPLRWFDAEMKAVLGVDVFEHAFPRSGGASIVESREARVCVLKLEHLSSCGGEALGEFLGTEPVRLRRGNDAGDKWYAPIYQAFLRTVAFDRTYLEKMYSSRLVRHFYSDDEIDAFRARWNGASR